MMSALCCAYGSFKAGRACAYNEDILRAVGHNRLVFRFGFVPDYRVKLTRSGLFEVYVCIAAVQAADAGSDIGKTAGLSLVWRFGSAIDCLPIATMSALPDLMIAFATRVSLILPIA